LRDHRYTSAYLSGAVCPERGIGAAVVLPHVNVEAMTIHLAEISRNMTRVAHAVLVLDQAGWHTSPKLTAPENISLLPLPPYAPELNPVEQVWARLAKGSGRRSRMEWQDEGCLRANFLGHRVWNSYDGIVDACCHAWNKLMNRPERLAPPHRSHLGQSGQQIGRRLTWSLAAPDHRRDQVQNPGVQSRSPSTKRPQTPKMGTGTEG